MIISPSSFAGCRFPASVEMSLGIILWQYILLLVLEDKASKLRMQSTPGVLKDQGALMCTSLKPSRP